MALQLTEAIMQKHIRNLSKTCLRMQRSYVVTTSLAKMNDTWQVYRESPYIYKKPKIFERFDDGFVVREMTFEDTRIVLNWYCNFRVTSPYDLRIAHLAVTDHSGFMVGDSNGVVCSSLVTVPWGEGLTYSSLLYVDEKFRGSKFAIRVVEAMKNYLVRNEKSVFGDVVENVIPLYEASGMNKGSFDTVTYKGIPKLHDQTSYQDGSVVKATDVEFEKILEYDNKRFVVANCPNRKAFLQQWLNVDGGHAVVVLDQDNNVVGLGQRRPCYQENYHKIGPIYADNEVIARCIFKELCRDITGEKVDLSIWSPNKEAVKMMEDFELKEDVRLLRMYFQADPQEYKDTTFAVTSMLVCGF